jgi:hypoxanthine phosphoribosyltransferase
MKKHFITPIEFQKNIWSLAAKVRASGWEPDVLIALWRGGATVGIALHEFFKVTGWNVDHVPLKCSSYTDIEQNGNVKFFNSQWLDSYLDGKKRVLLVDDVFDTGKTFEAAIDLLSLEGREIKTASVYWKPERNETKIQPDFYSVDAGSTWLVFPHEIEGLDKEEILKKDDDLCAMLSPFLV